MKHPAWLWLKKYQPEMLPGVDQSLQAIFDNGTLFESYVENTYPNSVKIGFSRNGLSYKSMPERTARAINAGARTVLQGRAEADGLTCIFDVLEHISGNNYALTEIKSSTKVKEEHILDLGFQKIVLEKSGIKIAHAKVRYVDPTYIRKKDLDIDRLVRNMREFLVIDGRNLWHDKDFSATPITYLGIGRSSQNSPVETAESNELNKLVS